MYNLDIDQKWPPAEVGSTELLLYRITEPNYFFCTGTGTDRYF